MGRIEENRKITQNNSFENLLFFELSQQLGCKNIVSTLWHSYLSLNDTIDSGVASPTI